MEELKLFSTKKKKLFVQFDIVKKKRKKITFCEINHGTLIEFVMQQPMLKSINSAEKRCSVVENWNKEIVNRNRFYWCQKKEILQHTISCAGSSKSENSKFTQNKQIKYKKKIWNICRIHS